MESLTEPPLESSTMVEPPSWRPRANSSNSRGLSAVMMPTAETQPRQLGWQSTQLNFIGSLRSSRAAPARAAVPSVVTEPAKVMQRAAAPRSARPRNRSDVTNLNLVPSPKPRWQAAAMAPFERDMILSLTRYQKRNRTGPTRP